MRYFVLFPLVILLVMGCAQSNRKPITELSQNEINSVILIDVRTPQEYAEGHIDNAININWYGEDFVKQLDALNKDQTIYVYCKKGGRSAKAFKILDSLGYSVVDLEGGYDAYLKK